MIWDIDFRRQCLCFLLSVFMGAALTLIYDIIRSIRQAGGFQGNIALFVTDVIFWVISAFVVYIFLLCYEGGTVRFYVLLAAGVGAVVFSRLCSPFVIKAVTFLVKPMVKFVQFLGHWCRRFRGFVAKGMKNVEKFLKHRINFKKTLETADNGSV